MADRIIGAKELRASLPTIVARVRRGESYTVLYRSKPAFKLVPVTEGAGDLLGPLEDDPIFRAEAVASSNDGLASADHDLVLYGARR